MIIKRQTKDNKKKGTPKKLWFCPHRFYCSSSSWRWGTMDPWHDRRERWSESSWQIIPHLHHNTGWIVTWNRHLKPAQISPEQYLWDQLHKHTKTDPLQSILAQLEKQPGTSNNNNNYNINNGPFINNPTHEHSTSYTELDNNHGKS